MATMKALKGAIFVLALLAFVHSAIGADDDTTQKRDCVLNDVNGTELASLINLYDYTAVYFYTPWCTDCKPHLEEVHAACSVFPDIHFAKVDGSKHRAVAASYQVSSYPLVALFFKSVHKPLLQRFRSAVNSNFPSIQDFISSHLTTTVPDMSFESLWPLLRANESVAVVIYKEHNTTEEHIFSQAAAYMSKQLSIVSTHTQDIHSIESYIAASSIATSQSIVRLFEQQKAILLMIRHGGKVFSLFEGTWVASELVSFMIEEKQSRITPFSRSSHQRAKASGMFVLYAFTKPSSATTALPTADPSSPEEMSRSVLLECEKLAAEFKHTLRVFQLDGLIRTLPSIKFDVTDVILPVVVLEDTNTTIYRRVKSPYQVTPESVRELVERYLSIDSSISTTGVSVMMRKRPIDSPTDAYGNEWRDEVFTPKLKKTLRSVSSALTAGGDSGGDDWELAEDSKNNINTNSNDNYNINNGSVVVKEPSKPEQSLEDEVTAWDHEASHVLVVDKSNFDSLILNSSYDVMLEVYSPWCVHCQHMWPTYKQVAELFSNVAGIKLAKWNAAAHGLPAGLASEIKGFPAIFFYRTADNKKQPWAYTGKRTVQHVTKYIVDSASRPLDTSHIDLNALDSTENGSLSAYFFSWGFFFFLAVAVVFLSVKFFQAVPASPTLGYAGNGQRGIWHKLKFVARRFSRQLSHRDM
eukprot:GILK01012341.1.p1 GENE.GILK01012341.1~~GILK01012341.1.p1  ORF type:complete len:715 (-),score=104.97 GILK01012341.1:34-2121(-)